MNLQRRNHYLAKCYQEGFTDSTGKVWVKFGDRLPEHRNPRSVGRQRSLYVRLNHSGIEDDGIEKFLATHVEVPFANLARRIKVERDEFANMTGEERGTLLRFIAAQTVRTLGHKECVDIQAGQPVDRKIFLNVMLRQMWTLCDIWRKSPPKLRFFTSLPYIGQHFIAGDNPVLVIQVRDNPVWVPIDDPTPKITQLNDILMAPNFGFWLPLSPYVCVLVQPRDGIASYLPPNRLEPPQVRMLNQLQRRHSKVFLLARDKESLN